MCVIRGGTPKKKKRIGFKQSVLCNVVLRCLKQIAWKQSLMFPGRVINLVRRLGKFGEFLDTDAGKWIYACVRYSSLPRVLWGLFYFWGDVTRYGLVRNLWFLDRPNLTSRDIRWASPNGLQAWIRRS